MKRNLILTTTLVALLLAGCSNNDENETDTWNGEIRLSSGVNVLQTRTDAPAEQIADGQNVGLFINDAITASAIGANLKYDADGNSSLTLNTSPTQDTPYYPATGNAVSIVAYHPYQVDAEITSSSAFDFTVKADQSTDAKAYHNSDLLHSSAKEYARQSTAHSLTFAHRLSKVVCTLTSGAGSPTIAGATVSIVNAQIKVSFKPSDGTFATTTSGGTQSAVTMNSSITSGSYIAIVPPQTFAKGSQFLQVTLSSAAGGGTLYYKIPNESTDKDLVLAAGNVYTYNITVNLTALTVTSTITPWTAIGNPVNGNAEM